MGGRKLIVSLSAEQEVEFGQVAPEIMEICVLNALGISSIIKRSSDDQGDVWQFKVHLISQHPWLVMSSTRDQS